MKPVKLSPYAKWALGSLFGSKTRDIILSFVEGDLAEAVTKLLARDFAGFYALLPDALKADLDKAIAEAKTALLAKIESDAKNSKLMEVIRAATSELK